MIFVQDSDLATFSLLLLLLVCFQEGKCVESIGHGGHGCNEDEITAVVEAVAAEGSIQQFKMCWVEVT